MQFRDTQPLAIDEQPSLEASLAALREHVKSYRTALADEGVWLFLATLGCWSVGNNVLQFCAFGLAGVMFAERVATRVREKRSSSELARAVELRIATAAGLPEERSQRLNELLELRRRELNALTAFRHGKTFLLAWLFYGSSFVHSVLALPTKSAG